MTCLFLPETNNLLAFAFDRCCIFTDTTLDVKQPPEKTVDDHCVLECKLEPFIEKSW